MSHFCLLVITNTEPSLTDNTNPESELHRALQPFHEYESTNIRDQYVVFSTEYDAEIRHDWEFKKETRYRLGDDDAALSKYDDIFYRDPTPEETAALGPFHGHGTQNGIVYSSRDWSDGLGYRAKILVEPETLGYHAIEVPLSDCWDSIERYAEEWFGCTPRNSVFGRWTNPNKKWDYWVVGGGYRGRLIAKSDVQHSEIIARPSFGNSFRYAPDGFDVMQRQNLDIPAMKAAVRNIRRNSLNSVLADIRKNLPDGTTDQEIFEMRLRYIELRDQMSDRWGDMRSRLPEGDIPPPRWDWMKDQNEEFARLYSYGMSEFNSFRHSIPDDVEDLELWIENAPPLTALAALTPDGVWHERGSMGWFGMVHDEKPSKSWSEEFDDIFSAIEPHQYLTIVDCHI